MTDKRIFLIDAMAMVYRAYFALMSSPRVTSTGKNTNAQFGFTSTLFDLLKKENPTHIGVVWDTAALTERHIDYKEYKANRQEAPEDLIASIPDIKRIIDAFNIPSLELDGYEADDIIGTLAIDAAKKGYEVYMVTPDKDYGQIVRENIYMYKPGYRGGTFEILGSKEICERWNIKSTDQVIDILGLMGDASDNIPGIPGVGEKTAAKLIAEFGSIEEILYHADEIKGKLGEKIRDNKDKAILSKKLASIITNVPIEFNFEDFKIEPLNPIALQEIFGELEFRALAKRVLGEIHQENNSQGDLFSVPNKASSVFSKNDEQDLFSEMFDLKNLENTDHNYHLLEKENDIQDFLNLALQQKEIAFDTETTSLNAREAEMVGMSFSWKSGEAYYIPTPADRQQVIHILQILKPLFDSTTIEWIGHNIKYDFIILKNYDFEIVGPYFDTMLAHYVISPEGRKGMDILCQQYLSYQAQNIETLIGKKGKNQKNMRDIDVSLVKEYAGEDADVTFQLKKVLEPLLIEEKMDKLFYEIENPLARILAQMEFTGVGLDVAFLNNYAEQLDKEIKTAEEKVFSASGVKFNLASPKQLGEVLFDVLNLDEKAKKTKTGQYKTGEDVLQKLRFKHPIIEDILIFRELSKLRSTYADALPKLISPKTNRLHTSFNQAIVSTGRLSSNNPNLQNIPIKTEYGKKIRRAFIAINDDHVLLSADYSQIELRVVAAMSGDQNMIDAFRQEKDIHTATAAKVYNIEESLVTPDMRRNAKAVNFGIIYGQSAFGLSESLGISRGEAKAIIDNYFIQYHSIKKFMDLSIASAKEHGFVETLKGRRIKLPDINSGNHTVRSFAERVAINAPIQGSAADMIKLAMIEIDRALKERNLLTKMILQVHDELVFDVPKHEIEQVQQLVIEKMENALELPNDVPIVADSGIGSNWLDAH